MNAKAKAKMEATKIGLQTGLQMGAGAGWFKNSTKVLSPVTQFGPGPFEPLVGPRLPDGRYYSKKGW